MTRLGNPITEAGLKNPKSFPNTGIQYSGLFEEWQAVDTSPGLNLWAYWNNGYNKEFMTTLIAFKRLQGHVSTHRQDAAIKKPKKR